MNSGGGSRDKSSSPLPPIDDAGVVGQRFLPFAVTGSLLVFGLLAAGIVAAVATSTIRSGVSANGFIVARNIGRLRSPEAGRVIQVGARAGDTIAQGQPLITLDTSTLQEQYAALRAQLSLKLLDSGRLALEFPLDSIDTHFRIVSAEARLQTARRALLRVMTDNLVIGDPDSVAAAGAGRVHVAIDVASAALLTAKADLALAISASERVKVRALERSRVRMEIGDLQARLEETQARKARLTLRAENDGVVLTEELPALLGEMVSAGQLLLETQEWRLWNAVLSVSETDIMDVHLNDSVDLELPALAALEENHIRGVVSEISARVTQGSRGAPDASGRVFQLVVSVNPTTTSGRELPIRSGFTVKARLASTPRSGLRIVLRSLRALLQRFFGP